MVIRKNLRVHYLREFAMAGESGMTNSYGSMLRTSLPVMCLCGEHRVFYTAQAEHDHEYHPVFRYRQQSIIGIPNLSTSLGMRYTRQFAGHIRAVIPNERGPFLVPWPRFYTSHILMDPFAYIANALASEYPSTPEQQRLITGVDSPAPTSAGPVVDEEEKEEVREEGEEKEEEEEQEEDEKEEEKEEEVEEVGMGMGLEEEDGEPEIEEFDISDPLGEGGRSDSDSDGMGTIDYPSSEEESEDLEGNIEIEDDDGEGGLQEVRLQIRGRTPGRRRARIEDDDEARQRIAGWLERRRFLGRSAVIPEECAICAEEKILVPSPCQREHRYCAECLQRWVMGFRLPVARTALGCQCPAPDCLGVYSLNAMRAFLTEAQHISVRERLVQHADRHTPKAQCEQCSRINMLPPYTNGDLGFTIIRCLCGHRYCYHCLSECEDAQCAVCLIPTNLRPPRMTEMSHYLGGENGGIVRFFQLSPEYIADYLDEIQQNAFLPPTLFCPICHSQLSQSSQCNSITCCGIEMCAACGKFTQTGLMIDHWENTRLACPRYNFQHAGELHPHWGRRLEQEFTRTNCCREGVCHDEHRDCELPSHLEFRRAYFSMRRQFLCTSLLNSLPIELSRAVHILRARRRRAELGSPVTAPLVHSGTSMASMASRIQQVRFMRTRRDLLSQLFETAASDGAMDVDTVIMSRSRLRTEHIRHLIPPPAPQEEERAISVPSDAEEDSPELDADIATPSPPTTPPIAHRSFSTPPPAPRHESDSEDEL